MNDVLNIFQEPFDYITTAMLEGVLEDVTAIVTHMPHGIQIL